MPRMSMIILARLSIHPYLNYGSTRKVVVISTRRTARSLILFLWIQRITTPGLQLVFLYLTTIKVLILSWDIHLQNQREILSLEMLTMGFPIPHLLLLIFHHCHILHIQILLKREIYTERDIKLRLRANTNTENCPNEFGNKAEMWKWNVWNRINWIGRSMP